jgi:long-chain acyl-CoA synthetase
MILTRIKETAARYPDKIAVQTKVDDHYQQYTYLEFLKRIASAARALSEKGIAKGDRVVLLSENRPEWILVHPLLFSAR